MIATTTPYGLLARRICTISLACALPTFLIGCDQSQNERSPLNAQDEQSQSNAIATKELRAPVGDDLAMRSSPIGKANTRDQYSNPMDEGDGSQLNGGVADADKAIAEVNPTAGYEATGTISFVPNEDDTQMNIHVALSGLSPGNHGLHIHERGDCSARDASSAGGHLNPNDAMHGSPQDTSRHMGDLGNIEADADGRVETTLTVSGLSLAGTSSVLQKAIVVHAGEDDLESDPAGNSGKPAGCGVILQSAGALASS